MKHVKLFEQFLNESFDITKEIKRGQVVYDGDGDKFKVIKITPNEVHLKPLSYNGDVSIFPKDFGKNTTIEEFWGYFLFQS